MSAQTEYITAMDAASNAATWLRSMEQRYSEDLGAGGVRDFQIEAALAQGWATLAAALS